MMDTYIVNFDETKEGVYAISLVENPAIEIDFIALSKQETIQMASVDEEKRLLISPVLIPDKEILRVDDFGNPYNIVFPAETIRQAQQNFYKQGYQSNSTLEHDQSMKLSDVTFVESWIIEDEVHDKSVKYGFNLPVGTWMSIMKVDSDEVWAKVKSGEVKGFSIDGIFDVEKLNLNKENMADKIILEKIKKLIENVDSKNLQLKEEKIEMALADDIKAEVARTNMLKAEITKARGKVSNAFLTYSDVIRGAYQSAKNAVDLIDQIEKKSKELGLGSTPYTAQRKEMAARMSELKKLSDDITTMSRSV